MSKKFEIIEAGILSFSEMGKLVGGSMETNMATNPCAPNGFYGCPTNNPNAYSVSSCKIFIQCDGGVFHNCPSGSSTFFVCPEDVGCYTN